MISIKLTLLRKIDTQIGNTEHETHDRLQHSVDNPRKVTRFHLILCSADCIAMPPVLSFILSHIFQLFFFPLQLVN